MSYFARYRPGDVVLTFTGNFYQRVAHWTPQAESGIMGVTPGRIAKTRFTSKSIYNTLKGKKPDGYWNGIA